MAGEAEWLAVGRGQADRCVARVDQVAGRARDALDELLGRETVGQPSTADEAQAKIAQTEVDVAVLDVRLGAEGSDRAGIEACRDIRSRDPRIGCVMLTSFDDDEALLASIIAGAAGYVLKQVSG